MAFVVGATCQRRRLFRTNRATPAAWYEIERSQLETLLVHLQCPALSIPIPQHDAFGGLLANLQLVNRRAVGMAMNQGAHSMFAHDPRYFVRGHIDNVVGFHARLGAAFVAQLARQLAPGAQGQMPQNPQAQRVAQVTTHAHVGFVAGAQAVAVHQQYRLTVEVDDAGVLEQGGAGCLAKGLAEHEVAIAMHQEDLRAAVAELAQCLANGKLVGGHGIVADPYLEEVPEDVQRLGGAGAPTE